MIGRNLKSKNPTCIYWFALIYSNQTGILSQVNNLKESAHELHLNSRFITILAPTDSSRLKIFFLILKLHLNILLRSRSNSMFLLRYNPIDPFFPLTSLFLGNRLHLVFHTIAREERKWNPVFCVIQKLFLNFAFVFTGKPVAVTNEIGVAYTGSADKYIHFPNTYSFSGTSLCSPKSVGDKGLSSFIRTLPSVPEIIFVASRFSEWQGLDILLDSVSLTSCDFRLHIVGHTNGEYLNDERVIFHDSLSQSALCDLYSFMNLGLSCFALFRKGMSEACPLKVREYLSHGIPVYAGHVDIFPSSFVFYHHGDPDFSSILSYCEHVKSFSRSHIIEASRKYIDSSLLLPRLEESLCL